MSNKFKFVFFRVPTSKIHVTPNTVYLTETLNRRYQIRNCKFVCTLTLMGEIHSYITVKIGGEKIASHVKSPGLGTRNRKQKQLSGIYIYNI